MSFNRVFNVGLPKTGTHSLHTGPETLGIRSLHNPEDLRPQTLAGRYRFKRDDWRALTNFCEHFYPQLDKEYPRSKFILTVREKESWLDHSCQGHPAPTLSGAGNHSPRRAHRNLRVLHLQSRSGELRVRSSLQERT